MDDDKQMGHSLNKNLDVIKIYKLKNTNIVLIMKTLNNFQIINLCKKYNIQLNGIYIRNELII
jgi:hypothetical protein